MEKAQNEVKEALRNLELPDGVQEPKVSRYEFLCFPIMSLSITNSDQSLAELTKTAEEEIIPGLEGVEGVSTVQISGQQVDEVQLKFDETKLKQYGLTEDG